MTKEEYDNFPQEVRDIVESWDDNQHPYEEYVRIKLELQKLDWTCDYVLSGKRIVITNITQIKTNKL